MIKRKLQVILFGVLLTFSASAQSQTVIQNSYLNSWAKTFVRQYQTYGKSMAMVFSRPLKSQHANQQFNSAAGALVINGEVQTATTGTELITALLKLVQENDNFALRSLGFLAAASPNT